MTKTFQNVKDFTDFFDFFDCRFKVIKEDSVQRSKVYKVSNDELLTVQVSEEDDPQKVGNSHYFIVLLSKEKKYDYVRVFGTFFNEDGAIQYNTWNHLADKKISNRNVISRMNDLKCVEQSVNPYLLLFGLNDEQRYVKGTLKEWVRESDSKLIIKGNLKEMGLRFKEWKKDHPSIETKTYGSDQCEKSHCLHFVSNKCVYGMFPRNNNKDFKLKGGSGYCEEYFIEEINVLTGEIFLPLEKFKIRIENLFELLIRKFDVISFKKFDTNVASPSFTSRKFAILMSIVNRFADFDKDKVSKRFKAEFNSRTSHYDDAVLLIKDYGRRSILSKPHKKAKRDMEQLLGRFFHRYEELIFELSQKIKLLNLYNRLIRNLFVGKKNISLTYSTLKEDMFVYFEYSEINETRTWRGSNKNDFTNVGRISSNSGWGDYDLAPSRYFSYYDTVSSYDNFPVYKVISVKSSGVELEDIETKQIVKLISSRKYSPKILFFDNDKKHYFIQQDILPDFRYIKRKPEILKENTNPKKIAKVVRIDDFFN